MTEVIRAARAVQDFLEGNGWRFCFIGGVAVLRWGGARLTQDADVTLYTGFQDEERYIDTILAQFSGRYPGTREFALDRRVLLLQTSDPIPFDVAIGGLPYEERLVDRASGFEFLPGVSLRTCSGEDLVIMKAFASRPIDWIDVEGIIIRHGNSLQWDLIMYELTELIQLKEEPEIMTRLLALKKRFIP